MLVREVSSGTYNCVLVADFFYLAIYYWAK